MAFWLPPSLVRTASAFSPDVDDQLSGSPAVAPRIPFIVVSDIL